MSHGCFNRKPLKTSALVQDGWVPEQYGHTRTPWMVSTPDPMTKTCQYSKDDRYGDPGCVGCIHKDIA